jgi:hypothetical protein
VVRARPLQPLVDRALLPRPPEVPARPLLPEVLVPPLLPEVPAPILPDPAPILPDPDPILPDPAPILPDPAPDPAPEPQALEDLQLLRGREARAVAAAWPIARVRTRSTS